MRQCPFDGILNVDRTHIFEKHLEGCGESCSVVQDSDGFVYIQHGKGHREEKVQFGDQNLDVNDGKEEDDEIEYEPEENYNI